MKTSNTFYILQTGGRALCMSIGFVLLIITASGAQNPEAYPKATLNGYFKAMPALSQNRISDETRFLGVFHNRLNTGVTFSPSLRLVVEGRSRLMYNEMYRELPGIREIFKQDQGLVNLTGVWLSEGPWIGQSTADRLFLNWRSEKWQIRTGRQRINWGINLVSNPNDLFNTYSFFDFDYTERPGADAIRVQYYPDGLSRIETAINPARDSKEMTAAAMYAFNKSGYDIQVLAGYFRNRIAIGGGWAGHLGGAGFKGEATWFYDLEEISGVVRGNLVAAAGIDYVFGSGTFLICELLYNGGFGRHGDLAVMLTQPLRADNIMFSKYSATLSATHAFTPLFSAGFSSMYLPDIKAGFLMPSIKYSLMTNLDFELVSQVFTGGRGSVFEQAGSAVYTSIKFSF